MTNLDIIKYLANNDPDRLAELLDDVYCCAWNCGAYSQRHDGEINENWEMNFDDWIYEDATKCNLYFDYEIEVWKKVIV